MEFDSEPNIFLAILIRYYAEERSIYSSTSVSIEIKHQYLSQILLKFSFYSIYNEIM